MKNISKLLALAAFVLSLTASAVFAEFKVGLTLGQGVWAATGEEVVDNNTTDTQSTGSKSGTKDRKAHGAFAESVQSIFAEYDHGPVSIGIQLNGDVKTPEATNIQQSDASGSTQNTNTVSATFSKEKMLYAIVDVPFGGLYLKAAISEVDVKTQEQLGTGGNYPDTNTDGFHVGIGIEREVGGLSMRVEVMGSDYDEVQATDENAASDETAKVVKINDMIGARATISLLKSF
tara:strand:+ start:89 stop:787 length:699 start_codon:yes stop_codon:yes gene_type:complete